MSDCKHTHCTISPTNSTVYQTLDELDFERGIWYAAQCGDLERVQKLLKQQIPVDVRDSSGYTALHYAARNGHKEICLVLLEHGADINAVTKSGLATPLHRAVSAGKVDVVQCLLENKADLKLKDADGKTALHRAAETQNEDLCQTLLPVCEDLKEDIDGRGKMPVDYALSKNLATLLKL